MKKQAYLLFALLFSAGAMCGQYTSQGNFMIGSTFGLSSASSTITQKADGGNVATENPKTVQFGIAPSVGYFLVDGLGLGIGLDYTFNQVRRDKGERNEDSDILFGPFARYYLPLADDMAFFLEASFGFGNSRDDMEIAGQPQNIRTNMTAFGVGPGLTIFSTSALGIEALFKYNYARSTFDTNVGGASAKTTTETNQFDFSVGMRFYFSGIQKAGKDTGTRLY
ncbi:MAG: outer membrane beta-barrel protein [Phaeodactylibacter sp.]|nr:outer membrane beta-barrel protein [Phaeodactylibacter sp.]MCB9299674.1 outer membrane beta-barrel protein [Lewinellaceae bacterium]